MQNNCSASTFNNQKFVHHTMYSKSRISYCSDAFRCPMTPSQRAPPNCNFLAAHQLIQEHLNVCSFYYIFLLYLNLKNYVKLHWTVWNFATCREVLCAWKCLGHSPTGVFPCMWGFTTARTQATWFTGELNTSSSAKTWWLLYGNTRKVAFNFEYFGWL